MTTPTAPAPIVYETRIPLRWRDLDAYNHANNSSYLTFLEETRIQWLAGLIQDWDAQQSAPVMAASLLNYRTPILWPATVRVQMVVDRLGNSSVTIGHRILSEDGATLHCDGHVVLVWIERRSGQPTALPEVVRVACTAA